MFWNDRSSCMILCQLFKGATPAQTHKQASFLFFNHETVPKHSLTTNRFKYTAQLMTNTRFTKIHNAWRRLGCIFLSSQQQLPTGQHPALDQGEWQPTGALVNDIDSARVCQHYIIRAVWKNKCSKSNRVVGGWYTLHGSQAPFLSLLRQWTRYSPYNKWW